MSFLPVNNLHLSCTANSVGLKQLNVDMYLYPCWTAVLIVHFCYFYSVTSIGHIVIGTSVGNSSKFPRRYRVRFHPNPDIGNGFYHTKNPDYWNSVGFTSKTLDFKVTI